MYRRDISAPLQFLRTLFLGRTWNYQNRFQDMLSRRPYPKPDLTGGSAHKASENYYYLRDGRRAVNPNQDVALKQIGESKKSTPPVPGKTYLWD